MHTRREFGQLVLAGFAMPAFGGPIDSNIGGVRLGVQTYSFRDLPRPGSGFGPRSGIMSSPAAHAA